MSVIVLACQGAARAARPSLMTDGQCQLRTRAQLMCEMINNASRRRSAISDVVPLPNHAVNNRRAATAAAAAAAVMAAGVSDGSPNDVDVIAASVTSSLSVRPSVCTRHLHPSPGPMQIDMTQRSWRA